jgi:hypothetical protein
VHPSDRDASSSSLAPERDGLADVTSHWRRAAYYPKLLLLLCGECGQLFGRSLPRREETPGDRIETNCTGRFRRTLFFLI